MALQGGDRQSLEGPVKEAKNQDELFLIFANETRNQSLAKQTFVFFGNDVPTCRAISNLPVVNRQSPLVQDLEQVIKWLLKAGELDNPRLFSIGPGEQDIAPALKTYPFKNLVWTPLLDGKGKSNGGVLYARDQSWETSDLALLTSLTETHAPGFQATYPKRSLNHLARRFTSRVKYRKLGLMAASCFAAAMFFPTTMKVSAPFQVVSHNRVIVSSPLQGVIEEVLVRPGARVTKGEALVKFVDTLQQNQLSVAKQEVDLTEARWRQANQLSFDNKEGRRDLGLSIAELAVKKAELKLAEDESARTVLKASSDGVVIFSDAASWVGKPVSVGEKILQIADPHQVQFEILLDITDSIALEDGALVKLFLDAEPFSPIEATISEIAYQAEPTPIGNLAYKLVATPQTELAKRPTLGTSGTAKIYGKRTNLAFYLFRRPISAARQWLGI